MKKGIWLPIIISLILWAMIIFTVSLVFAKEYKVFLDDKYVKYFEKQESVSEVGAEKWFELQALNEADKVISGDYDKTLKTNRDDKIDEIEK